MKKSIKNLCWAISFAMTAVSFGIITQLREIKEIERKLGFIEDKYSNMTLEQAIKNVKTWQDGEDYMLGHLKFNTDELTFDTRRIHETGKTICFGAAETAMELLKDNKDKYEIESYLFRKSEREYSHMIAVIKDKTTGKYGSLGINACDCISPRYDTKAQVFKSIQRSFFWKD